MSSPGEGLCTLHSRIILCYIYDMSSHVPKRLSRARFAYGIDIDEESGHSN